ncbi:hypothetical protein AgCh_040059 [Apium graveolens]
MFSVMEMSEISAFDQGVSFAAQTFKRTSKLRFLYLNKVNLTGSFEHTFEDLRWFCWKRFPLICLPSEFYAQKLVTLELPDSEMRTLWDSNMVPQVFENLKPLNMSSSPNLIMTPDFTRFPVLETLNLRDCSSLEEGMANCVEDHWTRNVKGNVSNRKKRLILLVIVAANGGCFYTHSLLKWWKRLKEKATGKKKSTPTRASFGGPVVDNTKELPIS